MSLKGLGKEGVFDFLRLVGSIILCTVEPRIHRLLICEFTGIDI